MIHGPLARHCHPTLVNFIHNTMHWCKSHQYSIVVSLFTAFIPIKKFKSLMMMKFMSKLLKGDFFYSLCFYFWGRVCFLRQKFVQGQRVSLLDILILEYVFNREFRQKVDEEPAASSFETIASPSLGRQQVQQTPGLEIRRADSGLDKLNTTLTLLKQFLTNWTLP